MIIKQVLCSTDGAPRYVEFVNDNGKISIWNAKRFSKEYDITKKELTTLALNKR